jgi:hypothetical protein
LKKCILVLLSLLLWLPLAANDPFLHLNDTLKLKEGSKIIMPGGSIIKIDRDTTIVIHSELDYKVRYPRGEAGDIFFDSLEMRAERSRWTRELHDIVITSPRMPDYMDTIQTEVSADVFLPYGGKFIRSIRYTKLEPFGPTLFDTTRQARSRMEKFGNEMHRITQNRVLENHLLFREGELTDPNEIADNERILRELPFIQDARIYVMEADPASDSVDILVLTKDAFSIGLGGSLADYDAGRLNIFEKNLLGMGHELHMAFYWDANRSPWKGHEIYYIMNNLRGTFIDSKFRFAQIFDSETYQVGLERRFFTPDIKWAGAFDLQRTREIRDINFGDTLTEPVPLKYNIYDAWAGHSFYLRSQRRLTSNRLNFIVASRIFRHQYIDRPEVSETSFYQFQNKSVWLNSFSVSSQSFFKSNLIRDFGRTEDVPQGFLLSLTMGPEVNEFDRRFYSGLSLSQGRFLGNFGYLYTLLEAGGYVKDYSYIEQGVVNAKAEYFTPLFIINRFKFRHFITASYVRGIRRYDDEYIWIHRPEGIRGYRSRIPAGQQKVVFNYEADAFTPFYLYGFRFVWFGFIDFAMIGPEYKKWHDGDFYSGLGMGLRIRNERLVFETITIRLGYYPNHPEKSFPMFLDLYGEERLNPDNFFVTKPDFVDFR